jgi:OmpA-OmpF porin, OOP family
MKTIISCSALAALLLASCTTAVRPAATSDVSAPLDRENSQASTGWSTLGQGEARYIRIDLGPDTFAECQRLSPKFPFDSANTYASDREQIAALASCLNAPGQRDRMILLVGRADPRGSDAYNMELGKKRALAIKNILTSSGVAEDRIKVSTEGKTGAVGDQPDYSYGYDRRVDIVVIGGTHVP